MVPVWQLAYLENSFAARISGAGFGIVATGLPPGSADALAATLCRDLLQLRADGLADSNDIGHIGIAMWRHGNTLPQELLSEADMALRSAQASGQNIWQRYQAPAANQPKYTSMENWRKRLREVIDKGAIQLMQAVYQTKAQGNSMLHKEVTERQTAEWANGSNCITGK